MAVVTASGYQGTKYFGFLDGIRALSALAVVTVHVRGDLFVPFNGERGVTSFFVVSGFLITTLALREDGGGRFDYRAFFTRRVFRILPLYYLALAATCFTVFVGLDDRKDEMLDALPYYLFYFQEYPIFTDWERNYPFSVAWTLGIEEKFYVVWPLIGFLLLRRNTARLWLALFIAMAPPIFYLASDASTLSGFLLPYAPIAMGCVLAIVLHHGSAFDAIATRTRDWMVPVAALAVVVASQIDWERNMGSSIYFALFCVLLLLLLTVRQDTSVHRFLGIRPLVAIGGVSYGLYLFHLLGLNVAETIIPESMGDFGNWMTLCLGLAITLPVCFFLHRRFEQPLIEQGRRRARRQAAGHAGGLAAQAPPPTTA